MMLKDYSHWLLLALMCSVGLNEPLAPEDIEILKQHCPNYDTCSAVTITPSNSNNSNNNAIPSNADSDDDNDVDSCCLPCSCDANTCGILNNCCPDIDVDDIDPDTDTPKNGSRIECVAASRGLPDTLQGENQYDGGLLDIRLGVKMVVSCPLETPDLKCTQPNATDLIQNLPVISTFTGLIYFNKFCAECNNESISSLSTWRAFVSCSAMSVMKADELMFPATVQAMYHYAIENKDDTCGFNFLAPENSTILSNLCFQNASIISSCPATYSDAAIRKYCNDVKSPYLRSEQNTSTIYQNYFCYLCNSNQQEPDDIDDTCPAKLDLTVHERNDYEVEVNVNGQKESKFMSPWQQTDLTPASVTASGVNCGRTKTFDPFHETCRKWYCPSEHQYVDGVCVPNIIDVINATFNIHLKLTPDTETKELLNASEKYNATHRHLTDVDKYLIIQELLDELYGPDDDMEKTIIILASRSDVEFMFVSVLIHVTQESTHKTKLYDPLTYGNEVSISIKGTRVTFKVELAVGLKIELSTVLLSDIVIIDLIDYVALENTYRSDITVIEDSFRYTFISKLAFCSQIVLERAEIRDYIDVIDIRVSDMRIHLGEFSRTSKFDNVHLCLSDYLRNAQAYWDEKNKAVAYSPQAILSVVCTLLSIAGLSFTIVTYIVFDELRSIPGKNNMMLALHLLIAQVLYQFGMDQTEVETVCIVFGIFIHMFWLTAIFWMNACTLHMFRTFVTGQSYRSVRACDPQVICYGMYCYSIAILMVALNIGVSMYRSDGTDFGYGGRVCYISNSVMVGWVFALPVGVIIILNMGFFFAVVYQISASTMRRRGKSTDRANTVIYMKLSSLTGVTWMFGFLYLWTDFAPLEYIFIVLNAGQGVFIFISFICTQRIIKLYWNLARKNCLLARAHACVCCLRKSYESEGNVVEMNTAKVQMSVTADMTSKKRKSKKPKAVLKLEGANFGSKSHSVCENQTKPPETPTSDATGKTSATEYVSSPTLNGAANDPQIPSIAGSELPL